ncbi:MAG: DUF4876 domain-containing protein [Muribaculaceae bacterium]|nr:DUF4876 domain-containing protein [Muribaculaceae bacterium]
MNLLLKTILVLLAALALTACDDTLDNAPMRYAPVITVTLPDELAGGTITSEKWQVKNVTTGSTITYSSCNDIEVKAGLYDILYDATLTLNGNDTHHITAYLQSVEVTRPSQAINMRAFENLESDDFVIEEIFFTGSLQPSGNQYYGDDYIKIYNNTDHVLYADGLTLLESKFVTTDKYDYYPDVMNECMTVQALYTIPGSGHDHPVLPGQSLLIADTGIDHRVANPNSFDLSNAAFEWYDLSTKPAHMDIDSPTVPNLDKWYCYTLSFFVLHNRGFRAWALARIPIDKDEYLKKYLYRYNYVVVVPQGTYPMSQTAYKVPNEWIVDAVNCSVEAKRAWNVTAPALDRGWTYCGTMDHDKSRYFHSVRRKMLYLREGRPVLQDTNNSSDDFNPYCIPSEIERQETAIDVNGNPCTTLTWDGVQPKQR